MFEVAEFEIFGIIPLNDVLQGRVLAEVSAFLAGVGVQSESHHSATRRAYFEFVCLLVGAPVNRKWEYGPACRTLEVDSGNAEPPRREERRSRLAR
jgi:hypothetical protein